MSLNRRGRKMRPLILILLFLTSCSSSNKNLEAETLDPQTREAIRTSFSNNRKQISDCYGEALLKKGNEELSGVVTLKFKIKPSGEATDVSIDKEKSTLNNPELNGCLTQKLSQWSFPKHKLDQVLVTYPLAFSKAVPQNMQNKLDRFEKLKK